MRQSIHKKMMPLILAAAAISVAYHVLTFVYNLLKNILT